MRKIFIVALFSLLCIGANAQYKKASFLTRSGRTYDLGFTGRFLSNGTGTMPGIYYSYGRDKGKTLFHWFDLEVMLPTSFNYSTYDMGSFPGKVNVSGKTKLGIAYRYNLAGYLISPQSESKVKPFATLGINIMVAGGTAKASSYKTDPEYADPQEIPPFEGFSCGANGGLGAIYNINQKIGLKLIGGYNYQDILSSFEVSEGYKKHNVFGSHPYVSFGVRFTMDED